MYSTWKLKQASIFDTHTVSDPCTPPPPTHHPVYKKSAERKSGAAVACRYIISLFTQMKGMKGKKRAGKRVPRPTTRWVYSDHTSIQCTQPSSDRPPPSQYISIQSNSYIQHLDQLFSVSMPKDMATKIRKTIWFHNRSDFEFDKSSIRLFLKSNVIYRGKYNTES
jgi:hypothetical protein